MWAAWLSLFLAIPAAAGVRQHDLDVRFPPPSVRVGDVFRADLRVKLHLDARGLDADPAVAGDVFVFRRARVAVEGQVLGDFEFELDADLRDEDRRWRDVLVNYRRFSKAEIQVGKFKAPFGLDQLTSIFSNNFVFRSLIGTQLAPGRDRGVMAHGRLGGELLRYRVGWFEHDGDNVRVAAAPPAVEGSWVGRLELLPWDRSGGRLRSAQLAVNGTAGDLAAGPYGLRGRTTGGFAFFEPVHVKGRRIRVGIDGRWEPGPFSLQGEYNRLTDRRDGRGPEGVDLPAAIAQGWYIAGTWALTGESRAGGLVPRRDLFRGGAGAVEIAARFEELRFNSQDESREALLASSGAAALLPNRDRALTFGVNWHASRLARVMFNAVRETIEDSDRSPLVGRSRFWTGVLRFQFAL